MWPRSTERCRTMTSISSDLHHIDEIVWGASIVSGTAGGDKGFARLILLHPSPTRLLILAFASWAEDGWCCGSHLRMSGFRFGTSDGMILSERSRGAVGGVVGRSSMTARAVRCLGAEQQVLGVGVRKVVRVQMRFPKSFVSKIGKLRTPKKERSFFGGGTLKKRIPLFLFVFWPPSRCSSV